MLYSVIESDIHKLLLMLSQLKHLEKLMRLNAEMDINVEGIETISYLLQRITDMQQHILKLTNKLAFYENE